MFHIDHVVVTVASLDRAAAQYERLGFTLTPRALHPWGTANRLVQFAGRNFIELLEVDRPALIPAHRLAETPPHFSFGAFNRGFLASGKAGFSMLVLAGTDASADWRRFARAGLEAFAPFDFERTATLPDGRTVTVAFSLAFTRTPELPDAGFFTCHNRYPENFWKPAFQGHANGATAIAEAILVAPEPIRLQPFLEGFTGVAAAPVEGGLTLRSPTSAVTALTPDAYRRRLPGAGPDLGATGRLAAIVLHGPEPGRPIMGSGEAAGVAIAWQAIAPNTH